MKYRPLVTRAAVLLLCLWIISCAQTNSDDSGLTGKPATDFSLSGIDNATVKLSDFKGKVVVVDFWATWCPPCRESLPNLNRLSNDATLAARGLKVLAVNTQESAEAVKAFLQANHYTLPVLLDTDGSAEHAYSVTGLPTTLVVGRDGTIKYASVGFDQENGEKALNDAVEKALDEK
jgi:peroxiredoxin